LTGTIINTLFRVSFLVAGAFAAWGLWLAEICWVKGWAGLAWLSGFNWSALPICTLIVVLCSFLVDARTGWRERMKFLGVGFVATTLAFIVARWTAFELFSGGAPAGLNLRTVGGAVFGALIVPVVLPSIANRWLAPLYWQTRIYLAVGLVLVVPLSFATIMVFPALNGSTDQIHSIKMGYPVFWTALAVPIALRLGRK
jgi:hypothetical protein